VQEGKTREQWVALLGSADRETRIEAASMLGDHFCPGPPPPLQPQMLRYFLPTAAPEILPLLSDPRPGTRSAAANALQRCGDGSAKVIAALEGLLLDQDEGVRVDAALAISHLECPKGQAARVLSHLIVGLKNRHRADIVALWLRQLGPTAEPAVPALIEALSSADVDTRLCVPLALGSIGKGARPALGRLREVQASDPEPAVRENVEHAIEDIQRATDGQRVGTMASKGCG
jgi:HEAT repeat protein